MTLRELIDSSENIAFLGGAGVSVPSGIPDFRSADGLYSGEHALRPEIILSHSFFQRDPETFFRFYKANMIYKDAGPNDAHLALAALERGGKLRAVITQNIDGLHQAAGSRNVLELHGSIHRNHCLRCGQFYPLQAVLDAEGVPHCGCGGVIKPDVVLYEEPLDPAVMEAAVDAIAACDLMLIGGTSLSVYPAAGLVQYCRGKLAVLNRSATYADARADLVITDSIDRALRAFID